MENIDTAGVAGSHAGCIWRTFIPLSVIISAILVCDIGLYTIRIRGDFMQAADSRDMRIIPESMALLYKSHAYAQIISYHRNKICEVLTNFR